jgi:hypothetical protein
MLRLPLENIRWRSPPTDVNVDASVGLTGEIEAVGTEAAAVSSA